MDIQPLFSVLVANYNNGHYLRQTLESVKRQTYTNWQVVIVDDGSTDDSHSIYKELEGDKRFKVVLNNTNRGCTYSKKRCIDESDGTLCGFVDADDALAPRALETMVDVHEKNHNASVVISRHYYCDPELSIIGESRHLHLLDNQDYLTHGDFQPEHFLSFKKNRYYLTPQLCEENAIGDDLELLLLLEEAGDLIVLDEILYYYRQHINSVAHSKSDECCFWNSKVIYEACCRRHINPRSYALNY